MTAFGTLLDSILKYLGDPTGAVWERTDIYLWTNEALRDFPILQPHDTTLTTTANVHYYDLPALFREVVAVEYPISQTPPVYLQRLDRLHPEFYSDDCWYDVDHDFASDAGHQLYISATPGTGESINVQYLATWANNLGEYDTVPLPDQYHNLIVLKVRTVALAERMSYQVANPTAHTSTIQQSVNAYISALSEYNKALSTALNNIASSKVIPAWKADAHDRIY